MVIEPYGAQWRVLRDGAVVASFIDYNDAIVAMVAMRGDLTQALLAISQITVADYGTAQNGLDGARDQAVWALCRVSDAAIQAAQGSSCSIALGSMPEAA